VKPILLGVIAQNLFAQAIWCPRFVHPSSEVYLIYAIFCVFWASYEITEQYKKIRIMSNNQMMERNKLLHENSFSNIINFYPTNLENWASS
jgi:hypothetical protein